MTKMGKMDNYVHKNGKLTSHIGVKLPVLLKIFNKQEFVSMFESNFLL